jgi:hypothetical protein
MANPICPIIDYIWDSFSLQSHRAGFSQNRHPSSGSRPGHLPSRCQLADAPQVPDELAIPPVLRAPAPKQSDQYQSKESDFRSGSMPSKKGLREPANRLCSLNRLLRAASVSSWCRRLLHQNGRLEERVTSGPRWACASAEHEIERQRLESRVWLAFQARDHLLGRSASDLHDRRADAR